MPITVSEQTLAQLHNMASLMGADTVTYFCELRDRPVYRFTLSTLPKHGKYGMPIFVRVLAEEAFYELRDDDYDEVLMLLNRQKKEAYKRAIKQQTAHS